jgi:hypothetical protein
LAAKAGPSCQFTVFEPSGRFGAKIQTGQFAGVGPYRRGVAEIYDYSRLGPDPQHDVIVKDFGSAVQASTRRPLRLDGKIILDRDDLAHT